MSQIETIMRRCRVIPVMVIDELDDAVPMAQALVAGGLNVLEITLRTSCALAAIAEIKAAVPQAIVGAGTVIDALSLEAAIDAGAEFLVSPGCTEALARQALATDVPLLPGIATPSEAMALMAMGFHYLKFFPAEAAGGTAMLKSIGGPLPQLKFCPTGGVNPDNLEAYLALDNVLCVGGSWMLDKQLVAEKNWQTIQKLAAEAASGLAI